MYRFVALWYNYIMDLQKEVLIKNILVIAETAKTQSDVAYIAGLLPSELDELLEEREYKIQFEQARIRYRESIYELLLGKGTGAQILELYLRSNTEPGLLELKHPREAKDDGSDLPDEIIIQLVHAENQSNIQSS